MLQKIQTFFKISSDHGFEYACLLTWQKIRNPDSPYVWPLPQSFRLAKDQDEKLLSTGALKCVGIVKQQETQYADYPTLGRVAVHVHVHYVDQLDKIKNQLDHIQWGFDLFISTNNLAKKQQIESQLKLGKALKNFVVEIVPNKGRDIAPLVLTFGKRLKRYNLALHLHSKVSPYGSITDGWVEHLYRATLSSPEHVTNIIGHFAANPHLGLLCAPGFGPILPYIRWQENKPIAEKLFKRWGLNLTVLHQPLMFSAGSFFWFRPDAIAPLLSENSLAWSDFPDEPLPNDGTICHAIERVVGPLTKLNGFSIDVGFCCD